MSSQLEFSPEEIVRRKAYLELGEHDVARLKELHDLLGGNASFFIEEFYQHLLSFGETRHLLQTGNRIERLKQAQMAYFSELTAGDYGPDYIGNRVRVGVRHQQVGLDPKWYFGAYNKYLTLLLPKVWEMLGDGNTRTLEATQALLRIIFLDMGIAIDTYIEADRRVIRKRSEDLSTLNQVAITLTSSLSQQEVRERIMRSGMALAAAQGSCIALYDEDSGHFTEWHAEGLSPAYIEHVKASGNLLGQRVFGAGECIVSNGTPGAAWPLGEAEAQEGIRGMICLPLVSRATRLGVLCLCLRERDTFVMEEVEMLRTFSHLCTGALDNARLHARTVNLASTDALTGLFNRRVFEENLAREVQRAKRYARPLSLLILDVDHFKGVNDTYGHPGGDAVLRQLADIIRRQLREVDSPARYGGEEMVIILPELQADVACDVAERIRRSIEAADFVLPDGRTIRITASFGVGSYPASGDTPELLTARADQALYRAKQQGRNRVCLGD